MKKMSETILFFGSGPVAAKSLELLAQDFTIEAVITKPRAKNYRGAVPVISVASSLGLPIHTVTTKTELDLCITKNSFNSPLGMLIDFGIIVSQKVINYFELGIVNSHFSLLPEWRGADPITFSILSGQKTTGISLMVLTAGMDEGPLLAQATYDLPADITGPELTEDLIELSHAAICTIIPMYIEGNIDPAAQGLISLGSPHPTYSRKLTKKDGIIDWEKSAEEIEREIRAFAEWPKSQTFLGEIETTITKAHIIHKTLAPGAILIDQKKLLIGCGTNSLAITTIKPAGKKEMSTQSFLAGYATKIRDAKSSSKPSTLQKS